MGEKRKIDVPVHGGMQDEGDPALAAEGVCELLKNVEYIDQGLYARQPFPSDYLVPAETPLGLFRWEDRANRIIRMMAISSITGEGGAGKLIVKSAAGAETWTQIGTDGNVTTAPVASYANYRGIVYFCLNDGVALPVNVYSYDGTTLVAGTPVPGLTARLVCVFGERVFYGNLQFVITNQLGATAPYDPSTWTLTSVTATKVTTVVGGRTAVLWRLTPTATSGGKAELPGAFTVTNSADPIKLVMLVMVMGVDPTYRMPMTIELVFRGLPWEALRSYVLGARRHPVTPNGFVYVCSQAGTSGASEPTWPQVIGGRLMSITVTVHGTGYTSFPTVTIGPPNVAGGVQATANAVLAGTIVDSVVLSNPGTGYTSAPTVTFSGGGGTGAAATAAVDITGDVTDGSCKWKLESSDVITRQAIEVPSTSDTTEPSSFYIDAVIPPVNSTYTLMLRYSFGTAGTPSVSLLPITFSMVDGLDAAVPLRGSFGQQLTLSSFKYPFGNASVTTLQQPDVGIWSESGEPGVFFAENTVILPEEPGDLTALFVAGNRLWWGKRRALWAFLLTKDPDFPILREKVYKDIGIISPKGADTLDDLAFVMGEDQIFAFDAKESPIAAVPLLPEGLRRTVMDHGVTWVESISAVDGQHYMPLLRVHPTRRQLWVHTQDRKIFVYDIPGKRWTYFEIPKTGGAFARIRDIEWNPTTRRMMVISENGLTRHAHRRELTTVGGIAVTASGSEYGSAPAVAIAAPPAGGVQATATATVLAGLVTAVTVTNPGRGYVTPPTVTFSGGSGSGAAATARLLVRDGDASGLVYDVAKRVRPRPFEVRPQRAVMTIEDVALYGKITIGQADSTCEVDISFDGGESFTFFNRVRLFPLSNGAKRRYPIPVRKTGESVVVDVTHTGATGNDVFNVLDVDANVIVRGEEQPQTRPTPVAKTL